MKKTNFARLWNWVMNGPTPKRPVYKYRGVIIIPTLFNREEESSYPQNINTIPFGWMVTRLWNWAKRRWFPRL